jgi:hypothetical protein
MIIDALFEVFAGIAALLLGVISIGVLAALAISIWRFVFWLAA